MRVDTIDLLLTVQRRNRAQTPQKHQESMQRHGDFRQQGVTRMIDCQAANNFLLGQLAGRLPFLCFQPPREIRNWRNHQNFISVPACQMAGPLVDKNRVRRVARVWEEARKGQNSQSRILGNSPVLSVPGRQDSSTVWLYSCLNPWALASPPRREYKYFTISNLQKEYATKLRLLATVVLYIAGVYVFRFTLLRARIMQITFVTK
jgi:hypothetical protein